MNYLAHLFLAGNTPHIIIGNFIADHVKGSYILNYAPQIQQGIIMHRQIDTFTDSNSLVKQNIEKLRPHFHKYAGVVSDMYYDHFLSKNWNKFSNVPIEDFSQEKYDMLQAEKNIFPERSQKLLYYMSLNNWLVGYASFEGLQRAFNGIAKRTPFVSNMEHATEVLKADYEFFESNFFSYFPVLENFVENTFFTL